MPQESNTPEKVAGEILEIRVDRIKRYERQPRTYFDEASLEKLAKDMAAEGQRVPVEVCRLDGETNLEQPFTLVDGERRWRVKQRINQPTILAVLSPIKTEAELFRRSVAANLHREEMTPVDVANAIARLAQESRMKRENIADMFGRSVTWVDQYLSLQKLVPEVQAMLNPGLPDDQRLNVTAAFQIAKIPQDMGKLQITLAEESIADSLPATDVSRRVLAYSERYNFSVLGRGRRPSDDWKLIRASIGRYNAGMKRLGNIDLDWVLLHRDDDDDRKTLIEEMKRLERAIDSFKKRVSSTRKQVENFSE